MRNIILKISAAISSITILVDANNTDMEAYKVFVAEREDVQVRMKKSGIPSVAQAVIIPKVLKYIDLRLVYYKYQLEYTYLSIF